MALTRITKGVIKPNENYDTHNINSTGIVTAIGLDVNGNGDISGNLNVGGVLTYEDVTSIDSIGIITARGGIDCNGDIDVDGHTNLDNVSVAGVTTFASSIHVADSIIHQGDTDTKIDFDGNRIKLTAGNKLYGDIGLSAYNWFYSATNFVSNSSSPKPSTYIARFRDEEGDDMEVQFFNTNVKNSILTWNDTGNTTAAGNLIFKGIAGGSGLEHARFTGSGNFNLLRDLDVDGHTNLDNVSIAGITTMSGNLSLESTYPRIYLKDTNHNPDFSILNNDGNLGFRDDTNGEYRLQILGTGETKVYHNLIVDKDLDVDGHTNLDNVSISGVTTFAGAITAPDVITAGALLHEGDTDTLVHFSAANTIELKTGSVSRLLVNNAGVNLTNGYFNSNGNRIILGDSSGATDDRLVFGNTNDFEIYHDGTLNVIDSATANLEIRHGSEKLAVFAQDGQAELYHNDIKTFTTTNEGATFDTGSSSCVVRLTSNTDAVTVLQGFNSDFYLKGPSGGNLILYANGNEDAIKCIPNGAVELYHNGNRQVFTIDGGMNWQDSKKAEFGNSGDLKIYHESGVNYIYGATASPIAFMAQADEKLRINTNGRVGIGTNNPQQLLDLYDIQAGASGTAPILNIRNGYAGTPNTSNALKSELRFSHRNHNSAHDFMATRIIADTSDNYNQRTFLRFLVAKGNNGTERLTIDPDGEIGINNTTPAYPLDIQHDGGNKNQTPIIRLFQSSDGCHNAITLESSTSVDKNIGIQFKNRSVVRGGIGYNQSDKMSFYSGTTPGGNGITINASGFVGINKSDPDRTFHVYRNSETWPAGFESNNTTCKISFKSAGTLNMYDVGVGAESRSLIFLTANSIRNDITTDGVMRTRTLGGGFYPVASVRDGSTSARAAQSAWEIKKTLGPAAHTGYYYLKNPYDNTVSQWWCDMDTDGGGWILVAHTGDGQMASLSTADGNHWWNRSNKGGFDNVGSGYYKGGGYWRKTNGDWGDNTCGQLMWDVRTQDSQYDNYSNAKVVFNWGTDTALPTGGSNYTNIPGNRKFNEWCYEVVGAPGFNPSNYHQNARGNVIGGANYFTEHMVITWSFRGTGGGGDDGDSPYWMLGSHHDGLHQHYEESLSGNPQGVYGSGGYYVVSNEDTGWGGGGSNDGYSRIGRHTDNGTCNVWLR